MRLNRYLAASGVASRRAAEALITEGRVRVNGSVVRELATFVEEGRDRVEVDGQAVRPPRTPTYLVLHKPLGFVTTAKDPEGRPTVLTLVPAVPRVFPVGRLDMDTSGTLLLTDDGDLSHRIQHPRYRIDKEYETTVEGVMTEEEVQVLRDGVMIEGERRPTGRAAVEVLERRPNRTRLRLVIHEGRNRQVRRMMEAVRHPVVRLHRVRVGPVGVEGIDAGGFRALTPAELTALRRAVGGGSSKRGSGRH